MPITDDYHVSFHVTAIHCDEEGERIFEEYKQRQADLIAKYEQKGQWNDLINALGRSVAETRDVHVKAGLLRRIAGLWLDKFGNQNQAVKPLEELDTVAHNLWWNSVHE